MQKVFLFGTKLTRKGETAQLASKQETSFCKLLMFKSNYFIALCNWNVVVRWFYNLLKNISWDALHIPLKEVIHTQESVLRNSEIARCIRILFIIWINPTFFSRLAKKGTFWLNIWRSRWYRFIFYLLEMTSLYNLL